MKEIRIFFLVELKSEAYLVADFHYTILVNYHGDLPK